MLDERNATMRVTIRHAGRTMPVVRMRQLEVLDHAGLGFRSLVKSRL
jgi:hypothetical protein